MLSPGPMWYTSYSYDMVYPIRAQNTVQHEASKQTNKETMLFDRIFCLCSCAHVYVR